MAETIKFEVRSGDIVIIMEDDEVISEYTVKLNKEYNLKGFLKRLHLT
jgi:hypothetical protein